MLQILEGKFHELNVNQDIASVYEWCSFVYFETSDNY